MRNVIAGFVFVAALLGTYACMEPADRPDPTVGSADEDLISPRSGCSQVDFCNVPNSSVGTRCTAQGSCSEKATEAECQAEVKSICGTATAPFDLDFSGGTVIQLHVGACAGGAMSCGGNCCNSAATFCGGATNNVCCDGVHCNRNCPC